MFSIAVVAWDRPLIVETVSKPSLLIRSVLLSMNAAVDFGGNGKEDDIVVTDVESSLDGEDSDV